MAARWDRRQREKERLPGENKGDQEEKGRGKRQEGKEGSGGFFSGRRAERGRSKRRRVGKSILPSFSQFSLLVHCLIRECFKHGPIIVFVPFREFAFFFRDAGYRFWTVHLKNHALIPRATIFTGPCITTSLSLSLRNTMWLKSRVLFLVLCATCHTTVSFTNGPLPKGNFEYGSKP
ncbi:hypothetical protein CK203_060982 [Vitis vinifera]|uniref:Uncharacterized protein n=1 Tax=Vitis vinifera TaxID=29760 RepID=A0A438G6M6_VITVI|nr:hypothetical protein CK203_060982 [Vitis vinifera]